MIAGRAPAAGSIRGCYSSEDLQLLSRRFEARFSARRLALPTPSCPAEPPSGAACRAFSGGTGILPVAVLSGSEVAVVWRWRVEDSKTALLALRHSRADQTACTEELVDPVQLVVVGLKALRLLFLLGRQRFNLLASQARRVLQMNASRFCTRAAECSGGWILSGDIRSTSRPVWEHPRAVVP